MFIKMAKCLRPIIVNVKTFLRDHPERLRPFMDAGHRYKELRPTLTQEVFAPCGKCVNCLKNRQALSSIRCQEEAEKRGSMTFVTLTYDDNHLPLAQSLWRIHKGTGIRERVSYPEIIYNHRSMDHSDIAQLVIDSLKEVPSSSIPRYFDFPLDSLCQVDPEYDYFARVTPSVCREDARLWLKNGRVAYLREFGHSFPDFSYQLVSEYGKRSCRPHYHLLFFGLPLKDVYWLCKRWTYGYFQYKEVPRFNPDGSDAFSKASKYVSKYMNKGKFECDCVKDGCAERPRVCQSKGLGSTLTQKVKDYLCCFDLYGAYDLETLRFCKDGMPLSNSQIDTIIKEIPKRFTYSPNGKDFYPSRVSSVKKFLKRLFALLKRIVLVVRRTLKSVYVPRRYTRWCRITYWVSMQIYVIDNFQNFAPGNLRERLWKIVLSSRFIQKLMRKWLNELQNVRY